MAGVPLSRSVVETVCALRVTDARVKHFIHACLAQHLAHKPQQQRPQWLTDEAFEAHVAPDMNSWHVVPVSPEDGTLFVVLDRFPPSLFVNPPEFAALVDTATRDIGILQVAAPQTAFDGTVLAVDFANVAACGEAAVAPAEDPKHPPTLPTLVAHDLVTHCGRALGADQGVFLDRFARLQRLLDMHGKPPPDSSSTSLQVDAWYLDARALVAKHGIVVALGEGPGMPLQFAVRPCHLLANVTRLLVPAQPQQPTPPRVMLVHRDDRAGPFVWQRGGLTMRLLVRVPFAWSDWLDIIESGDATNVHATTPEALGLLRTRLGMPHALPTYVVRTPDDDGNTHGRASSMLQRVDLHGIRRSDTKQEEEDEDDNGRRGGDRFAVGVASETLLRSLLQQQQAQDVIRSGAQQSNHNRKKTKKKTKKKKKNTAKTKKTPQPHNNDGAAQETYAFALCDCRLIAARDDVVVACVTHVLQQHSSALLTQTSLPSAVRPASAGAVRAACVPRRVLIDLAQAIQKTHTQST